MAANASRAKGHKAEQNYATIFRELGFTFCKTTRVTSYLEDCCKIDLGFLPWNIQIKAGAHKALNVTKVFNRMRSLLTEHFPPYDQIHGKPFILIHRLKPYSKSFEDDVVYMSSLQFDTYRIALPTLEAAGTKRYRTSTGNGEFENLVTISFATFRDKIVPRYL